MRFTDVISRRRRQPGPQSKSHGCPETRVLKLTRLRWHKRGGLTSDQEVGNLAAMVPLNIVKALANERRLAILGWLKNPRAHFPPQVDGDLVRDGVCGVFIAHKLGVTQPTASEH